MVGNDTPSDDPAPLGPAVVFGLASWIINSLLDRDAMRRGISFASTLFIVIVWVSPITAQTPVSNAELEARRTEISTLSDADRSELLRKYQDFQKLSKSEQDRFRHLHQEIESNPRLKSVMQDYCEWLKALNVAQREQLRSADTPEKKRLVVERIRQEQKRQQEEQSRISDNRDLIGRMALPQLAKSDDLKSLMGILETCLSKYPQLDPGKLEKIKKLTGTLKYQHLLRLLAEIRHPKDSPPPMDMQFLDEFRQALTELLPKPLRNSFDGRPGGQQKGFMWLLVSLLEEARREFSDAEGDELRETLFRSLSPHMQSEFLQTPPEMQPNYLKRLHLDELRRAFLSAFGLPQPEGMGRTGDGGFRGDGPFRGDYSNREPGGREGFNREPGNRDFSPREGRGRGPNGGFGNGPKPEPRPGDLPPRPEEQRPEPPRSDNQ